MTIKRPDWLTPDVLLEISEALQTAGFSFSERREAIVAGQMATLILDALGVSRDDARNAAGVTAKRYFESLTDEEKHHLNKQSSDDIGISFQDLAAKLFVH